MTFTSTLDLGEIGEQDVTVEFDYQPAERQTRDDPGCSAEVEITSIIWSGIELKPFVCKDLIDQLEQEAFEWMDGERDSALSDRAEYLHYLRKEAA
jgi:hypothetical protein